MNRKLLPVKHLTRVLTSEYTRDADFIGDMVLRVVNDVGNRSISRTVYTFLCDRYPYTSKRRNAHIAIVYSNRIIRYWKNGCR
jgi:hypothetical protein